MTRRLTLLFSAFEALLVVAIGVAIPLLPATVLWAAQFGFAPDWVGFWRAAVDIWLIGHGVDVTFVLDEATAAAIGTPAGAVVLVTIAALGFALLTLLLGVRAGGRIAETGHRLLGELTSLVVFAGLSFLVTFSVLDPSARPSLWQGTLLPGARVRRRPAARGAARGRGAGPGRERQLAARLDRRLESGHPRRDRRCAARRVPHPSASPSSRARWPRPR